MAGIRQRGIVVGKHLSKGEIMGLASEADSFGEERDREGLWVSPGFGSEELEGSCSGLE